MSRVTYYVALPFLENEDGDLYADQAEELQMSDAAIRRARELFYLTPAVGAVAFARAGDPERGEFDPAEVLARFGRVPKDLSKL
jgi:hypothetical protein